MKLWAWDKKNLPSIGHAIRTAAAATASVIIVRLVQMPEAYWAAIATLVVMQSTLGATLMQRDNPRRSRTRGKFFRGEPRRVRGCDCSHRLAIYSRSFLGFFA